MTGLLGLRGFRTERASFGPGDSVLAQGVCHVSHVSQGEPTLSARFRQGWGDSLDTVGISKRCFWMLHAG